MIQNEQILEYIDGLLGPDAEQALFDAMARQPELRSALRQFIVIGDAVRADREAYTPPSDVERALMNNLGLGNLLPYAGVPQGAPAVSGVLAGLSSFGGRFWGMLLSFLLGALVAGSSVAYVMNDESSAGTVVAGRGAPGSAGSRDAAPKDDMPKNEAPGNPAANGPASGAVPQSGGGEGLVGGADAWALRERSVAMGGRGSNGTESGSLSSRRNGAGLGSPQRQADRSVSMAPSSIRRSGRTLGGGARDDGGNGGRSPLLGAFGSSADADGSASSRADITPVQPRAEEVRDDLPRDAMMPEAPSRAPQEFLPVAPEPDDAGDRTGRIALEGRMNLGGSYQPNNALRSPSPTDDLMGSVLVHPAGPFAFGAEFGKESFDQTLYSISAETLQVEQRPSYLWLGATGRLYLGELPFGGIETFVQGTAAYSTGGPVMRLRLGGRMPVSPALDLTFGAETAGLIYTFQDRQFVSGRWGLSGGVQWTLW